MAVVEVDHSFQAEPGDASGEGHKRAREAPVRPDGHSRSPVCSMEEAANVADPFGLVNN